MSNARKRSYRCPKTIKVVRKIVILIFVFTYSTSFAQQIDTADERFKVNHLEFHEECIKTYHVKSMSASNRTKKDGQPLKLGHEYYNWVFDINGLLVQEAHTEADIMTNVSDTIKNIMRYDREQKLTYQTQLVGHKIKTIHYSYNFEGKLVETNMRERLNYGHNPPFIQRIDSFSYQQLSDSTLLKLIFNEDGTNYREQQYIYDDQKRIIEKKGRYLRGDIQTKETYKYNPQGYLIEKIVYQDVKKNLSEKYVFSYDKMGNINKVKTYRDDINKRNIDFIYFDDTLLLKAIIDQDVESHELNILRFEYEFYDKSSSDHN